VTDVLIVDDQQLVRDGLRMLLSAAEGLTVVGEAADGVEAIAKTDALRPDIVLMDVHMPRMGGIDATRHLISRAIHRPRVLVLTTFSQSEVVYDALVAGASGFLLKDMPSAQLIGGIHAISRGEELLAPELTRRLIEQFVGTRSEPPGLPRLTERERDVLLLVATGLSNAEIGQRLYVSIETVKTHVSRVLDKLDLRDRVQAVVFAYEAGLVRAGSTHKPRTT
jgi:DNA-binding NarL/FixJ family response regulator